MLVLSYEGSFAMALYKDNISQIVVSIEVSNDVLWHLNLKVDELKAIVSEKLSNANLHWYALKPKLWKDNHLNLLLSLANSSPMMLPSIYLFKVDL